MKPDNKPLFSIITVTYNAENTVLPTLQSVDSQTCGDYEHLIIDGASKDKTMEIVNAHSSKKRTATSEPDKGIYDAMNKGISIARGKYLIFLNAGDKFHSETTLQTVADTIKANKFPGVVYGQTQLVDAFGNRIADRHLRAPEDLTYKSFAEGMMVCHQAFIAYARLAPMYDLRFKYSADYDWCIQCLQHSRKNVLIDDILIDYLNEGMTTANHRASLIERFKIMCYYFGTFPTVMRHIKFIPRYLKRRSKKLKQ